MRFDYYYGSQADQFSFIRIPRVMIKDPAFVKLSAYAKLLYSVLLDRMSLSSKNGWFDEENRVYIVYPVTEVQDDLGIGKKKAMEVIAELVEFGLLEKKRRGQGLPSLLYVKSFMTGIENSKLEETEQVCPEVSELVSQESGVLGTDVFDPTHQDMENIKPQETAGLTSMAENMPATQELSKQEHLARHGQAGSEVPNRALQEIPESTLQEVSKPVLLEVSKPAPLMSQTDNNYTYRNYILSHHIDTGSTAQSGQPDAMRCDENAAQKIQAYQELIHENIRYDDLCAEHQYDRERIDGIVDLIMETVLGKDEQIRIASNLYPAEIVRSKFLKLGYEHIDYVLDCLDSNTTKVRNIKKYLLAALFNAPSTMKGYYQAEVNHDMPQYSKRAQ